MMEKALEEGRHRGNSWNFLQMQMLVLQLSFMKLRYKTMHVRLTTQNHWESSVSVQSMEEGALDGRGRSAPGNAMMGGILMHIPDFWNLRSRSSLDILSMHTRIFTKSKNEVQDKLFNRGDPPPISPHLNPVEHARPATHGSHTLVTKTKQLQDCVFSLKFDLWVGRHCAIG